MIEAEASKVTPTETLLISRRESVNRFYECAATASADYIVTGNLKHFAKPYRNTRIITPRQLLELVTGQKP